MLPTATSRICTGSNRKKRSEIIFASVFIHDRSFGIRRGGYYGKFERLKTVSGISSRQTCDLRQRDIAYPDIGKAESPFLIIECISQNPDNVIIGKRIKLEHGRTRDQSFIDFKEGILRGRAYQDYRPVFHKRKESILLQFIESVYLIDKQDCLPAL
jgi:hypothetical protein